MRERERERERVWEREREVQTEGEGERKGDGEGEREKKRSRIGRERKQKQYSSGCRLQIFSFFSVDIHYFSHFAIHTYQLPYLPKMYQYKYIIIARKNICFTALRISSE